MKNTLHCSGRFRDLSALGKTPPPWTHVASLGEYPGTVEIPEGYNVPGYGVAKENMTVEGLTVFNEAGFEGMLKNFRPDMLIDADHLSHDQTQSTEALGWGVALRRSENGSELELETPWTPPGREKITTQVYRYISPEFAGLVRFESGVFKFYPDKLAGAGLTNRPKLKILRPVSANRTAAAQPESPARIAELEAEIKTLKEEAIERDLETYKDVIGDKETARELLQMNRAVTVKHFAAQLAQRGMQTSGPAPLYQKNRATAPDGSKFYREEGEVDTAAQRALVASIQQREKCKFSEAWNIAKTEKPHLF